MALQPPRRSAERIAYGALFGHSVRMEDFDPLCGPATLPAQLAESAARFGDALFLVAEDGRRVTFRQAEACARRVARGFIAAGMEPDDRIAIWAPNGIEWVIACLGLQLAGGVLVPINTRFKGEEAASVLERARVRILCTVGSFLGNDYVAFLRAARGEASVGRPVAKLPALERIVLLDDAIAPDTLRWSDFVGSAPADETQLTKRISLIGPASPSDILYTSGTTGQPKGAVHRHAQALGAARAWGYVNGFAPGDRVLIVNPFFHSFGYRAGWVSALVSGLTAYPVSSLDIPATFALIARERITVLPGPPTLFQTLLDHPDRKLYDLSSLRIGATGSADISATLFRRAREELGLDALVTSYGLTEASAMVTSCRLDDDDTTMAARVGAPFPGVEIKVVDPAGDTLPFGEAGELLVRGFNVMQGYFEDPQATAAAIDTGGWLHTGDVGVLDERNYLRLVDRLKDIIIVGGFNAYPAEIEQMLRAAPGVADVAVVGLPDLRMGEVCAAFIIPEHGANLDDATLAGWARANFANYKVPRRFFMIDAFPRTALGKVQKGELRKLALSLAGTQ